MGLIVQKYGGTSVADAERIRNVARRIIRTKEAGNNVVVVVSARGDTTDQLYSLAYEISQNPPKRELDVLVATGEQESIALVAMAIHALGHAAVSFTAQQVGIFTDDVHQKASIRRISPERIQRELAKGSIVMAATFDFDVALGAASNKNVTWAMPEEGAVAYLEGFYPIKGSNHLDVVYSFLDFHLEPKNYAGFVNATGSAWVMPAAEPYIDKAILNAPSLQPDPAVIAKVEFEKYLGAATALWTKTWEQFLAA